MKAKTKTLTLCAMMVALSVVFMFVGNLFPIGRMGFMAVASLFTVAVVIQSGYIAGLAVFIVSTLLGILLLPDKSPLAFYGIFFVITRILLWVKSISFSKSVSISCKHTQQLHLSEFYANHTMMV